MSEDPLTILLVVSRLERDGQGGIGRVSSAMAAALAARGHRVHLAGREDRPGAGGPELEGVTAHAWPARTSKLGQVPHLLRALRSLRPDVLHFHASLPHAATLASARLWRGRGTGPLIVCTPHTGTRWSGAGWPTRTALRLADRVVVPSAWSAEQAKSVGVRPDRIGVVSNGIDLPDDPEAGPAREPLILAMGRLVPSKGMDVLVEAFASLGASAEGWSLILGGTGPEGDALQARIDELSLAARLPGQLGPERKRDLLGRAAIGVVPSRADNLPGTLLEMQAHGLAVVASAVGGLTELADGGEAARLVPPGDVAALAGELQALMSSEVARKELGRAAREMARQRAWPVLAEQLEAHYQEALLHRS